MGTYKGEEPSGMFSSRPTLPVSAVCAQNNHVREKDYFQSENLNPSPPKKKTRRHPNWHLTLVSTLLSLTMRMQRLSELQKRSKTYQ